MASSVRQIATFLNIDLSDEQVERVVVANTFKNKKKEGGLSNALVLRKGTVSSGGTKGSNAHIPKASRFWLEFIFGVAKLLAGTPIYLYITAEI